MVDARLELSALVIAAPAKESAIVQLGHRCVGGCRASTVTRDVRLSYVHRFHCIIEFPGERYFRRVRLQFAGDSRGLLSRHAEYLRLARLTYRHDWKCKCWFVPWECELRFARVYRVRKHRRHDKRYLMARERDMCFDYATSVDYWILITLSKYVAKRGHVWSMQRSLLLLSNHQR